MVTLGRDWSIFVSQVRSAASCFGALWDKAKTLDIRSSARLSTTDAAIIYQLSIIIHHLSCMNQYSSLNIHHLSFISDH